jgi:hypothetical protein
MIISQFKAENFKGCSFEHTLTPITIFHGRNFAHKTARLEAMAWLLAGYIPGLSSKPADLFESRASGSRMGAGGIITFSDKDRLQCPIKRSLWREKGKVKSAFDSNGLGEDWKVNPAMVDPRQFLDKSQKEQVRTLFKLARLKREVTSDTVTALLKNIRLETNTKETEHFIGDLCDEVENSYESAIRDCQPVQEWIISLSDSLKEKADDAKKDVERMSLTVQGISELRAAQAPEQSTINETERILTMARQRESKLSRDIGVVSSDIQHGRAAQERLHSLTATLAECKDETDTIKLLRDRVDGLLVAAPAKPDLQPLLREERSLVEQANALKQQITSSGTALAQQRQEYQRKMNHTACPYCGADNQDWSFKIQHEFQEVESANTRNLSDLQQRLGAIDGKLADLDKRKQGFNESLTAWTKAQNMITDEQSRLNSMIIRQAKREQYQRQLTEIKVPDVTHLQAQMDGMQNELASARAAVADLESTKTRLATDRITALQKLQAAALAQEALDQWEITKLASKAVRELCAELTGESVGEFLERVNSLCSMLPRPVEYHANELGYHLDGQWIRHDKGFSGTEAVLFSAGLSVALAEGEAGVVLIDEFRNLDPQNRWKALEKFSSLIERGIIGQVIIADPDPSDLQAREWQLLSFIEVT